MGQDDDIDALLAAHPALEKIIGAVMRDVFYTSFERRFGRPDDTVIERVKNANPAEIAEWMPNFVSARNIEDIFVSGIEYALAQYAATIVARNFGLDVGSVHRLAEVADALPGARG